MRKLLTTVLIFSVLLMAFVSCDLDDIIIDPSVTLSSDVFNDSETEFKDVDGVTDNTNDTETDSESSELICSEGLSYIKNFDGKSYTVIGIGDCKDSDIVIDTYDGLPVTNVSIYAFTHCTDIKSVTLGPCVEEIGHSAFHGCNALERVIMTDSVTKIGVDTFGECRSLKSVKISKNLNELSERCFYYCSDLTEFIFSGTKDSWNEIDQMKNWDYNTGAYVVKCVDGEIEKPVPEESVDPLLQSE